MSNCNFYCRYCGGTDEHGVPREPFATFRPQYVAHRYKWPFNFGSLDLFVAFRFLGICDRSIWRTCLVMANFAGRLD